MSLAWQPADQHSARVYLASLTSAESRRTMRGCLDRIGRRLLGVSSR